MYATHVINKCICINVGAIPKLQFNTEYTNAPEPVKSM